MCFYFWKRVQILKIFIFHSRDNSFPIKISLVISSNKKAYGITYAKKISDTLYIRKHQIKNYENKILKNLKKYNISFICLAGYMRIISNNLIKNYKKKNNKYTPLSSS